MDALIIVDMQNDIRELPPKLDLEGVIERIDRLAGRVRDRGGHVFFVQHDGNPEDGFIPHSQGWEILDAFRLAL